MTGSPAVLPETHHGSTPHHATPSREHTAPAGRSVARRDAEPAIPPALAAALRLDRRVWLAGGAIAGIGALLAIGVPASALLPFALVGACLGMHLFMGHGGHAGHAASSADRGDGTMHGGGR